MPHATSDVFSLSDEVLSDSLHFIEEIGFGNWGSVWACRPKSDAVNRAYGTEGTADARLAIKLVHRSKTPTTAARIKSLWNEMKIIKSFKHDPHPSIITFHSFIISPSYAIITMTLLPSTIPVEVDEPQAKDWFKALLSALHHLHSRGVVHNDIKPTNILLSETNTPVIIDFGFAEKYDAGSDRAFHSNLSYGTPEYLAPERACGRSHDTRKADIWALGVTFFEILIGRTPFEYSESEQCLTKEDLKKYYARTLQGTWVGTWSMSKSVEKLLGWMIAPKVDSRCTASQALADPCWALSEPDTYLPPPLSAFGAQMGPSKVAEVMPPRPSCSVENKENIMESVHGRRDSIHRIIAEPSPLKGSPPISPIVFAKTARKPFEPLSSFGNDGVATSAMDHGAGHEGRIPSITAKLTKDMDKADASAVVDPPNPGNEGAKEKQNARERMLEWQRERERLREEEMLKGMESQSDEEAGRSTACVDPDQQWVFLDKEDGVLSSTELEGSAETPSSAALSLPSSRPGGLTMLRQNVKASIDKTMHTISHAALTMTPSLSPSFGGSAGYPTEDEALARETKPPLPLVHHGERKGQPVDNDTMDRIAIWMRNVEKVVEEARQGFASTSRELPPHPHSAGLRPPSHSYRANRPSRLPRNILTASQIFASGSEPSLTSMSSTNASVQSPLAASDNDCVPSSAGILEESRALKPEVSPTKARRATMSEIPLNTPANLDRFGLESTSSLSGRDRPKSQSHFLERRIAPFAQLELELAKEPTSPRPSRLLSLIIDRRALNASAVGVPVIAFPTCSSSDLTSTRSHAELFSRKRTELGPAVVFADDKRSSSQRHIKGVYDHLLITASGEERVGVGGYQSHNPRGSCHDVGSDGPPPPSRIPRFLYAARAKPLSSASKEEEKMTKNLSVDECNDMACRGAAAACGATAYRDAGSHPTAFVRRAFRVIAAKTATARRHSRAL